MIYYILKFPAYFILNPCLQSEISEYATYVPRPAKSTAARQQRVRYTTKPASVVKYISSPYTKNEKKTVVQYTTNNVKSNVQYNSGVQYNSAAVQYADSGTQYTEQQGTGERYSVIQAPNQIVDLAGMCFAYALIQNIK